MDRKEIVESIACCGLVCAFCHLSKECDGCKYTASRCASHSQHWGGCFQRNCCADKRISGCWECDDFPCDREMFDTATHGVKMRAHVRCIKEDGADKFIEYIMNNEKNGIKYGYQKDYDLLKTEDAVLGLLRTGLKKPGK